MHGLILAGGEGSRLAASGITTPKPLVSVAGMPQVVRLIRTFERLGCETITCLLREGVPDDVLVEASRHLRVPLSIVRCNTPSSLHTLAEGLRAVPPGPVLCSMVDTVMARADWARVDAEATRALTEGNDAVLVVTGYVEDERPLYVNCGPDGRVTAIGNEPSDPVCVTGGVYILGPGARSLADSALELGLERMRAYLGFLVARGARVHAVSVARVIDLDDRTDLDSANSWQELCKDG